MLGWFPWQLGRFTCQLGRFAWQVEWFLCFQSSQGFFYEGPMLVWKVSMTAREVFTLVRMVSMSVRKVCMTVKLFAMHQYHVPCMHQCWNAQCPVYLHQLRVISKFGAKSPGSQNRVLMSKSSCFSSCTAKNLFGRDLIFLMRISLIMITYISTIIFNLLAPITSSYKTLFTKCSIIIITRNIIWQEILEYFCKSWLM